MISFFLHFSAFLIFLPLLVGLLNYRSFGKELKIVLGFVFLGALTEIFSKIYKGLWGQNTMPIGNLYIPLSVLVIGFFYITVLKSFVNKKITIGLIVLYEVFCLINILFIQNLFEFPNISGALGALLMLFFSIVLFSKIMLEAKVGKLLAEPTVWVNLGVLVYNAGSLFYFVLFNYSLQISNSFAYLTVMVNAGGLAIFYLLIAIGFWKAGRQKATKG